MEHAQSGSNPSPRTPHPIPRNGWPPGNQTVQRLLKESAALMVTHRATCAEMEKAYNTLWDFTCQMLHDDCRAKIFRLGRCFVDKASFAKLTHNERVDILERVQSYTGWVVAKNREQGYVSDANDHWWYFFHKLVPVAPVSANEVEGWYSIVHIIPASLLVMDEKDIQYCSMEHLNEDDG